jgi:hypothetical protein
MYPILTFKNNISLLFLKLNMSQWFLGVIIGEKAVLTAAHCIVSRSFYAIKVMLMNRQNDVVNIEKSLVG